MRNDGGFVCYESARMTIELINTSPEAPDAQELMGALSRHLQTITGDGGTRNFTADSVQSDRAMFVIAYRDGRPCGCGALRPLNSGTTSTVCEIKRMYSRLPGEGIGSKILKNLEQYAVKMGYLEVWLETRRVNVVAMNFYKAHGYVERENYGPYVGRSEAVCFEKKLNRTPAP